MHKLVGNDNYDIQIYTLVVQYTCYAERRSQTDNPCPPQRK